MSGGALDLQTSLFVTLTNSADLTAVLATDPLGDPAVYDAVPPGAADAPDSDFPFVVVGEDTLTEWDGDDWLGFDAEINVHVYARQLGREQVKIIQGVVYNVLHRAEPTINGFKLILLEQTFSTTFPEPDQRTHRGHQRFRCVFEKTAT